MALTNSQHDIIMRQYQDRQLKAMRERDALVAKIHDTLPELQTLEDEAARIRSASFRDIISGNDEVRNETKRKLDDISLRKKTLLAGAGLSPEDLEIKYTCKDCKDTGYIFVNERCHCFKQAAIKLIFDSSHMGDILERENFDSFSLDIYSDDSSLADEVFNKTPREFATDAYNAAREFCDNFDKTFSNMFLYGQSGVGKTFLTNCIAKELMSTEHSVIYLGSSAFFETFSKRTFENDTEAEELVGDLYECDLLIIDDLGTELSNSFTVSKLFNCIDERIRAKRSTIISSNLDLVQFMDTYSERVFSRVTSCYTILKLTGDDLRRRNRRN